jgi:sec-independent protein translocase protein TatA
LKEEFSMLFPGLGLPEMLIILAIVVVVFGVGRLADVGKSVGDGIREFKKAQYDSLDEAKSANKATDKTDKNA